MEKEKQILDASGNVAVRVEKPPEQWVRFRAVETIRLSPAFVETLQALERLRARQSGDPPCPT